MAQVAEPPAECHHHLQEEEACQSAEEAAAAHPLAAEPGVALQATTTGRMIRRCRIPAFPNTPVLPAAAKTGCYPPSAVH